MYNSFDISKKLLEFAKNENRSVDPMKLLKLVYISHGWYLGLKGEPLIEDEIQAWQYGPVIPELYHATKRFGTHPVDAVLIDLYSDNDVDMDIEKFLKSIWKAYGKMSAIELSARTHKEGTAWEKAYTGEYHVRMDNEAIKTHYKDLVSQAQNRIEQNKNANV